MHFAQHSTEQDYDFIVIGSGAGGLSAAVTAAHLGLKVLILEKESVMGGTTAWSGGWMWIPRNGLARAAGVREPLATPYKYLKNELGADFDCEGVSEKIRQYLTHAPRAIDFFSRRTQLQFIDGNGIPDFHGKTVHSAAGGRSVCAAPFDGRLLGEHIHLLRKPLDTTTLWGMGIASGAELKHFFNALRSPKSLVYVASRVLTYLKDIIIYKRGMRLVNGNALVASLLQSAIEAGVEIRTNATVTSLTRDVQRVSGVIAGGESLFANRGVVLACGGFPHDAVRWMQLETRHPHIHHSAAPLANTGEGLRLGEAAGGRVAAMPAAQAGMCPVSIVPGRHTFNGKVSYFPHLLERAKPGLIAVNAHGLRFANEANSYHDLMQSYMQATEPDQREAWLICDHAFIRRWGLGAVKPAPLPLMGFIRSGYLKRGNTLAALAQTCGIDAIALAATVENYNRNAAQGEDPRHAGGFGRGDTLYNRAGGDAEVQPNPCLLPLIKAPFYAVKIVPGSLGTFAGLLTNAQAQVLNSDQSSIDGLYACGNDMASIMQGRYPSGGITLGPALTFGYIAAHHAAQQALQPAAIELFEPKEHPMYYELTTLTVKFGTTPKTSDPITEYVSAAGAKGTLCGVWYADIGELNKVHILREFLTQADLDAERERGLRSADPFGCAEFLVDIEMVAYKGFDFMPPVNLAQKGPVYEIRTYGIKLGGVPHTIAAWEAALPAREVLSPCVVAMYALDGSNRFTNIWAYPSLEARNAARADSVAQGVWPPKGGPEWLTTHMKSAIGLPTKASPLK